MVTFKIVQCHPGITYILNDDDEMQGWASECPHVRN